jgi:hypothetical protein
MMEDVNSSTMYLIYYKSFCKCHNVPLPSTTIKNTNNYGKNRRNRCFDIPFPAKSILPGLVEYIKISISFVEINIVSILN